MNTTITEGKAKRVLRQLGTRKDVKKAYVTLEDGNMGRRIHWPVRDRIYG